MDGDVSEQIRVVREVTRDIVMSREGGRCILCNRQGYECHEITQRNHYPMKKQIEAGIFAPENTVLLCHDCHEDYGNTKWGEVAFKVFLYKRYGIGERPSLIW